LSLGLPTIAALAALCYMVLLGGTAEGELQPVLRLVNAGLAAALILYYVLKGPAQADRVDRYVLAAVVLFSGAAVLSAFPRQSFDALLAALTYGAGLFMARERLHPSTVRVAFVRVLMGLSLLLTLITFDRWIPPVLEWSSIADWRALPPLDLNLPAAPWGHRHDLALLCAMLYPSWWIGPGTSLRRASAIVIGALTLVLILVDGSRMLWLAVSVATAFLAIPPIVVRWQARRDLPRLLAGGTVAAAILLATGAGAALVDRLSSVASLAWRGAMWGSLTDAWLTRPFAGFGPGSFPWVLQLTDYFNTSSYAPRHPDSVLFQLLGEAGLLGIAALLVLMAGLLPSILRSHSSAARWSLVAFAVAGLGSNPTDFAFVLVVAIGWAAYAVPHQPVESRVQASWNRGALAAALLGLGVAGLAYSLTLVAAFGYDHARESIEAGREAAAIGSLDLAVTLDPDMALYSRQRGTLHYLLKDQPAAIQDLSRATQLNPSDDLAWRTLAFAYAAADDQRGAQLATDRAVTVQRSDPTNLLLLAQWQRDAGLNADALATLGEVVQAWPAVIGAADWRDVLPDSATTADAIDEAVSRWERRSPSPEPFSGQAIWLAVLGNRPDLVEEAIRLSGTTRPLALATVSVFRCDANAASVLDHLAPGERRTYLYWLLRLRESALAGAIDQASLRMVDITGGTSLSVGAAGGTLNPLNENGAPGFSADAWGYRRSPIEWPADAIALPSPEAGAARWLLDPRGAMRETGLTARLRQC
jgi:O-antigen ligase/tetratricopeptide (TPR) repeat protein